MLEFRWIEWNEDHATRHGVSKIEAERVVNAARKPWPRKMADGKWMVQGRGIGDRFVQVVYLIDNDDTIFIIHAMPLSGRRRRSGK